MIKSTSMRRRRPEELSLNLTPLIDVVFLLLIFFMVSTSFKQSNQLGVELPHTKSEQSSTGIEGIQLGITASGGYKVGDLDLGPDRAALQRYLTAAFAKLGDEEQQLYILGDKLAPHQSVVTAMDVAQSLGVVRIRIMTEQNQE